ncbi:hypothetical protein EC973_003937 [Apophysomyces ossiformis]|uniref:N-acetyltransferase domain-containing protein n=1 Tax=Apophysomyces ossiformis TaxID=679940 RepID=A0A8H7ELR4_9FUNG|nr:hypothetical protein EC973_003937 [Apophysomyces ossiformis]
MAFTEPRKYAMTRAQAVEWTEFAATNEWAKDALASTSWEDNSLPERCVAVYYVVDKEKKLHVVIWSHDFKQSFKELSLAWIEELYEVEESDIRQVEYPEESIIKPGGQIFMLLDGDKVAGTVAMMIEHGKCELGKMAVSKAYQGRGFAHPLMMEGITWARKEGHPDITLLTDINLVKAVSLYEKYGFKITHRGEHPMYKRVTCIMHLEF